MGEVAPPTSPPASFPAPAGPALDRKETFSQLLLASTLVSSAPGISLGLTKPDLALVYEGNEIPAPGGTAAGALGRPFRALLLLQVVTCCLQLGVGHHNLMKVLSR